MKKIQILLLGIILGAIPTALATTTTFSDVSESDWYYEAVESLAGLGIIEGYEDGTYKPSSNVNRAEIAVMLNRLTDAIRNGCIYRENVYGLGLSGDPEGMLIFLDGDTVYESGFEAYECHDGTIDNYTWDPEWDE